MEIQQLQRISHLFVNGCIDVIGPSHDTDQAPILADKQLETWVFFACVEFLFCYSNHVLEKKNNRQQN